MKDEKRTAGGSGESELPFEDALTRLEQLVAGLEGDELDLEDSLRRFEEGVKLVRVCSQRLEAADLRLRQLEEGSNGPEERDLAIEADE